MKKLLFTLLLSFGCLLAFSQAHVKGSGVRYDRGVPTVAPGDTSVSTEFLIDLQNMSQYQWDRLIEAWVKQFNVRRGNGAPSGDPGDGPEWYVDNLTRDIYWWNGMDWNHLNGNGGPDRNGLIDSLTNGNVSINAQGNNLRISTSENIKLGDLELGFKYQNKISKLRPFTQTDAGFGNDIAVHGNLVVVSAERYDGFSSDHGGVAFYEVLGDSLRYIGLYTGDSAPGSFDRVGSFVDVYNNLAVVSEHVDNTFQVWKFEADTMRNTQNYAGPPPGVTAGNWARGIGVGENYAIIGGYQDGADGSASLFKIEADTLRFLHNLYDNAGPGQATDFGRDLAMKDSLIVINSNNDNVAWVAKIDYAKDTAIVTNRFTPVGTFYGDVDGKFIALRREAGLGVILIEYDHSTDIATIQDSIVTSSAIVDPKITGRTLSYVENRIVYVYRIGTDNKLQLQQTIADGTTSFISLDGDLMVSALAQDSVFLRKYVNGTYVKSGLRLPIENSILSTDQHGNVIAGKTYEKVLYVNPSGVLPESKRGNKSLPYPSPWDAYDIAQPGDLVYVSAGTYTAGDDGSGAHRQASQGFNLYKDSVTYYFEPGAVITLEGVGTGGIMSPFENKDESCSFLGHGTFIANHAGRLAQVDDTSIGRKSLVFEADKVSGSTGRFLFRPIVENVYIDIKEHDLENTPYPYYIGPGNSGAISDSSYISIRSRVNGYTTSPLVRMQHLHNSVVDIDITTKVKAKVGAATGLLWAGGTNDNVNTTVNYKFSGSVIDPNIGVSYVAYDPNGNFDLTNSQTDSTSLGALFSMHLSNVDHTNFVLNAEIGAYVGHATLLNQFQAGSSQSGNIYNIKVGSARMLDNAPLIIEDNQANQAVGDTTTFVYVDANVSGSNRLIVTGADASETNPTGWPHLTLSGNYTVTGNHPVFDAKSNASSNVTFKDAVLKTDYDTTLVSASSIVIKVAGAFDDNNTPALDPDITFIRMGEYGTSDASDGNGMFDAANNNGVLPVAAYQINLLNQLTILGSGSGTSQSRLQLNSSTALPTILEDRNPANIEEYARFIADWDGVSGLETNDQQITLNSGAAITQISALNLRINGFNGQIVNLSPAHFAVSNTTGDIAPIPAAAVYLHMATEVSSATTAIIGTELPVNTSSAAVTITPPPSPTAGQRFAVFDSRGTAATNNITVTTSTDKYNAQTTNYVISTNYDWVEFRYVNATIGWRIQK